MLLNIGQFVIRSVLRMDPFPQRIMFYDLKKKKCHFKNNRDWRPPPARIKKCANYFSFMTPCIASSRILFVYINITRRKLY